MNNGLKNTLIFVSGAVVGILATGKLLKDYYEKQYQEDLESVKKAFSSDYKPKSESDSEEDDEKENNLKENIEKLEVFKKESKEYKEIVKDYNKKEDDEDMKPNPYVITEDEFGEDPNFQTITLTCYADKVVTDELDEVVEEDTFDDLCGLEVLDEFDANEVDVVYVRDDYMETDYEILLDERKYSDCH